MTSISILGGDWEILLDDEKNQNGGTLATAGMRTVQRTSGASSTVYTTNQLYSAVAEAMDDFIVMGFRNAMLPTTPNAYTMENKYFIPRSSTEFLKEGAITANWSLTASPDTNGNGVIKVAYSGGTNFVSGDIGRKITQNDSGDTGTLLDFDIDPDGTTVAWIRPDDSTPVTGDIFDGTGVLQVTTDGGTGTSTASVAGVSGTTQYSAIQVIGSVPTATEVYIYQDRNKLTDSTGGFQWWTTDTTVSLGIISILVRVQDMGTLVADGDIEVFARRYTALYDNFRLNVSAGGFSALPLASSPDINNTTGYRTANLSSSTGTWEVGNGIYQGASWATATARGVITGGDNLDTTDPDVEYYLVGDLTDLSTGAVTVTEYDFVTAADDDASATNVDTVGVNLGGPTDTNSGEGGTVTIALGHTDVDHTGDGVTEPYSITVDCQSNVAIAKVYERLKYVTRRGATTSDLFGAGTNVPGESYRGIDGVFEYDATTGGGFDVDGDDIFTTTGGSTWTARLVALSSGTTPTYFTVTDQQTSIDAIADDDVVEDEAGSDTHTVHAGGTLGIVNFTSPKSSPFGTFTGSQIFGARGVSFINFAAADVQAYILTDDFGTLNSPPNTVSFTVTNTAALDRILVARDTGTAGIINKDQFNGLYWPGNGFNGLSDTAVKVSGTIDSEVPQVGYIRIVSSGLRQEHHYEYSSRTAQELGVFTLTVPDTPSGYITSADTDQLIRASSSFSSGVVPVRVGMLVRNTTAGKTTHVWEVSGVFDDNTLDVVPLYGPLDATQDWDAGDTFEINRLIGDHTVPTDYDIKDNIYDLILDLEADATSESNSFTKTPAADFDVVVNVRQGKVILPFTLNQTQGDGSTTVTVVRQPDTIAT